METDETLRLKNAIWRATVNQQTFGAFEVTLGFGGRERVDFMTYNRKGEFRTYELKVSLSDFRSRAALSFVGHLNYLVIPVRLLDKIKNEVPKHIGIFVLDDESSVCRCVRPAKRQELMMPVHVLKDSMIRSLCRDVNKQVMADAPGYVDATNRELAQERAMARYYEKCLRDAQKQYSHLYQVVSDYFGDAWADGPGKDYADNI